jgi:hypothetical protein
MSYSVAEGKLIHEKTRGKKSRDTVPLKGLFPGADVTDGKEYCERT